MTVSGVSGKYDTPESRWAGVGPYYAMFPSSFASTVIDKYTEDGDVVLDPFAGRGTALFAAASNGRRGIGVEINPVGWVYAKAKLQTARLTSVEDRLRKIGTKAASFEREAERLPEFFKWCFSKAVREFLVAARSLLDWRRNKTDWTTMALILVDLHGKRDVALSNQMRQTKAMAPQYALNWWKERNLSAPERDPVEFMVRKIQWRYAKGTPEIPSASIYLGDSRTTLLKTLSKGGKAQLLLTSPPYQGVTNYFYDQWIRIWLLGGPAEPNSNAGSCKRRFGSKAEYKELLKVVFQRASRHLARNAVIYVRTDARSFTQEATIEALECAFPRKRLQGAALTKPTFTQTNLFDSSSETPGEIDLVMW